MAFRKGEPRPPNSGRKKGSRNKATLEIKAACRALLEDPEYLASRRERILAGDAPHLESLLYGYAYGKPASRLELSHEFDSDLTITIDDGE